MSAEFCVGELEPLTIEADEAELCCPDNANRNYCVILACAPHEFINDFGEVMSTEYYHRDPKLCEHCGRSDDDVLIGTYAGGWEFYFSAPGGAKTADDWLQRLAASGSIVDEYGRTMPLEEFKKMLEETRGRKTIPLDEYGQGFYLSQSLE